MSAQNSNETRFHPLLCKTLPEDIRQKAQRELNETEEKVQQGLQRLKSFIDEHHLPVSKEDTFLLSFLRIRKFCIEEAEQTVKRYANLRRKYIKYFGEVDFDTVKLFLDLKYLGLLPYRDEEGQAIITVRERAWTSRWISAEDTLNCYFALFHFLLEYPITTVSGFRIISDFPLSHVTHYFSYFKMAFVYSALVTTIPIRVKRADTINQSRLLTILISAIWHLIPKKIQNRLFFHGKDRESFFKSINPSLVPEEFGGTQEPIDPGFFINEFREFYSKMKMQNELYKSNRNTN